MKTKNLEQRKRESRIRRHRRVRAKVFGSAARPRMAVYRSLSHMWVQIIDDDAGKTLVSASDKEITTKPNVLSLAGKTAYAYAVGERIAKKAAEKGITTVVFDRGGFSYHGRVKAVADGARAGGLTL